MSLQEQQTYSVKQRTASLKLGLYCLKANEKIFHNTAEMKWLLLETKCALVGLCVSIDLHVAKSVDTF